MEVSRGGIFASSFKKNTDMLRNQHLVIIGIPAWEGDYQKSTLQLAARLARHNQVLYVEYPFTWKDAAMGMLGRSKAPYRRMLGREQRLRKVTTEVGSTLHVLTLPPFVPTNFMKNEMLHDAAMQHNARRAQRHIREAMSALQMHHPVVVNAMNPMLGVHLAGQFDEQLLLYYCYDEIGAATWLSNHGARLERHFMRQADAVICSSEPLAEAKDGIAHRTFTVKNGVDYALFAEYRPQAAATQTHKHFTVGYVGSIDERLDYELLTRAARTFPNVDFVFTGRVNSSAAKALEALPNVTFTGPKPPSELPAVVHSFDVGLIPFLKNDLTAGIYPLKVNEYLACGKAVVSTNFGDLSDFGQHISVASSHDDFIARLERAIYAPQPHMTAVRKALAAGNSWDSRTEQFGEIIRRLLSSKPAVAAHTTSATGFVPDAFNRWGPQSALFFS